MSDGRRWNVKFTDNHNLNIFADELAYIASECNKLPYGVLAILADSLRDLKSGDETDIDETDWPTYEKMYYFVTGILLAKEEQEMAFDDQDLDRLENIIEMLITKMSLLEGHFAGILDARFVDGEWLYGMSKEKSAAFLRHFQNT